MPAPTCSLRRVGCAALVFVVLTTASRAASGPDESELYRLAIESFVAVDHPAAGLKRAVWASTFDPSSQWRNLETAAPQLAAELNPRSRSRAYASPETIESFLTAVRTQKHLPTKMARHGFVLIEKQDAPVGWEERAEFNSRLHLANGMVTVSRIGFDSSYSQALVWVSYVCGSLCGHFGVVMLQRDGSHWRVAKLDGWGEY